MSGPVKLTHARQMVLAAMAELARERDGDRLDCNRISRACGHAGYWARNKLRDMAAMGLVEVTGRTWANAHTWRITDAGRRALSEGGA